MGTTTLARLLFNFGNSLLINFFNSKSNICYFIIFSHSADIFCELYQTLYYNQTLEYDSWEHNWCLNFRLKCWRKEGVEWGKLSMFVYAENRDNWNSSIIIIFTLLLISKTRIVKLFETIKTVFIKKMF